MIGNDIVDLNLAWNGHRWNSSRFQEKVFTGEEQEYIRHSCSVFESIWLLWSMKESAYKAHLQIDYKPCFVPYKIKCQIDSELSGNVTIDDRMYRTTSIISSDCVYTISVGLNQKDLISEYEKSNASSLESIRALCYSSAIEEYAKLTNVKSDALEIRKNSYAIPQIFLYNQLQSATLSLTHHGQFFGYAMIV